MHHICCSRGELPAGEWTRPHDPARRDPHPDIPRAPARRPHRQRLRQHRRRPARTASLSPPHVIGDGRSIHSTTRWCPGPRFRATQAQLASTVAEQQPSSTLLWRKRTQSMRISPKHLRVLAGRRPTAIAAHRSEPSTTTPSRSHRYAILGLARAAACRIQSVGSVCPTTTLARCRWRKHELSMLTANYACINSTKNSSARV